MGWVRSVLERGGWSDIGSRVAAAVGEVDAVDRDAPALLGALRQARAAVASYARKNGIAAPRVGALG
ncbi:hypothetical protein BE04_27475 [Sorangium cellulosum]|uniref:Uncharacterized protein n=2 Tax=Sorangium cellulosum TaxID=56 RepID=A0A150PBS4_SORCE|nr:hypothetical protein SCE1572_20290 [Sorangium cellulosum So0157-2]KYF53096.1 hypothetical protein BE04_27475 [Sorangium cellulosum]